MQRNLQGDALRGKLLELLELLELLLLPVIVHVDDIGLLSQHADHGTHVHLHLHSASCVLCAVCCVLLKSIIILKGLLRSQAKYFELVTK